MYYIHGNSLQYEEDGNYEGGWGCRMNEIGLGEGHQYSRNTRLYELVDKKKHNS